jgi:ribosome-binding protein aMBF1 (putative translation factor)
MQNIKNFQTWGEVQTKWMKNPKFVREYKKLGPRYKAISALIGARLKKKLSQTRLAQMAGTQQSAIARLESGNTNPTVDFLARLAGAMGSELTVQIK